MSGHFAILEEERQRLLGERDQLRAKLDEVLIRLEYLNDLKQRFDKAGSRVSSRTGSKRRSQPPLFADQPRHLTDRTVSPANGEMPENRLRPTDAILDYVRHHPNARPKDVVDAVAGKIQSSAADPVRMLDSLIRGLVRRRKLVRDASREGLLLPEED